MRLQDGSELGIYRELDRHGYWYVVAGETASTLHTEWMDPQAV